MYRPRWCAECGHPASKHDLDDAHFLNTRGCYVKKCKCREYLPVGLYILRVAQSLDTPGHSLRGKRA